MKHIYTKTGDDGTTSLRDGLRVEKDDLRIETNGQIDMLNSLIGLISEENDLLTDIQRELMTVMSHVATPDGSQNPRPLHCDELTARMEQAIDATDAPKGFVLPRGIIHVVRAQCRTTERRLWTLSRQHSIAPAILTMINRLSDYLFILALEKQ